MKSISIHISKDNTNQYYMIRSGLFKAILEFEKTFKDRSVNYYCDSV